MPLLLEHLPEPMENLGSRAQGLREARCPHRDDHELLNIDVVVCMGPAVEDVHHRDRQVARFVTTQVLVERQPGRGRSRLGNGQRGTKNRVRPEPTLVVGTIEIAQRLIDLTLAGGIQTQQRVADLRVHMRDRVAHALAQIAGLVAVPKLHRLERSGGRTRRHRRPTRGSSTQRHLDLDGRIAAAI